MDFLVREVRAVTNGPLHIVRLGSCAGLRPDLPVGTVAVASEGSIFIGQNPDAWAPAVATMTKMTTIGDGSSAAAHQRGEPYVFYGVAPADKGLSEALLQELKRSLGGEIDKAGEAGGDSGATAVVGCLNASADSFYSSQGV